MKLKRYQANPILEPLAAHPWENACATNPGVWYDGEQIRLLYQAGSTDEHTTSFGLAVSTDGYSFERAGNEPVFGPSNDGFDGGCVEDPRIVRLGDVVYVTYTTRIFHPGLFGKKIIPLHPVEPEYLARTPEAIRANLARGALAATRDFKTWFRLGPITPSSMDDRRIVLFPDQVQDQCLMLHSPRLWVGLQYGCEQPSLWLSAGPDLMSWKDDALLAQPETDWEAREIGPCAPPLKTDRGWLALYFGIDHADVCRVGALMLDELNPLKVIGRTRDPIMEPEEAYETSGLIPNRVLPSGHIVRNDELLVYYGAAETSTALATVLLDELVDHVLSQPPS